MARVKRPVFAPNLLAREVAVVTGGGSGIGLAIAAAMVRHGADVVIAGRSQSRLAAAMTTMADHAGRGSPGGACLSVVCDVRDAAAVAELRQRTLSEFGTVTILVNNAAANFTMAADAMTRRAFSTVVDVDLVGSFNVTREFVRDMASDGGGTILNIVVPEAERGFPGYAHCGAAKAGVVSLTRTWAREWGPHGIRVNAIAPGPVPTAGAQAVMPGLGESTGRHSPERIPLGRTGTPEDIATAAVFLCSKGASWVSGAVLTIDGGMSTA